MSVQKKFRVLTYNIHKGFDTYGVKHVLKQLRQALRVVEADVVFLQEVMGEDQDNGDTTANQLEFLADQVWTHFAYGQNAIHSRGHHGNAILSKFPILTHENINISTNRLERRGILHGVIRMPARDARLHLLCIHLNLLERGRTQQIQKLIERVKKHVPDRDAMIIAGDSNDWRGKISQTLKVQLGLEEAGLAMAGEHVKTFPSFLPLLPLDRIYFRGVKLIQCDVLAGGGWDELSDHRAVVADFEV